MNFLNRYNEELRQLRDTGARFAKEHPQVAGALGMHPHAVTDPFVERLLEGVAYLTARVQTRLDHEYAEFAQHALGSVCPLFMSATPGITSFAFHPDLESPETMAPVTLPRGTQVMAQIPGRKLPVMFSTARAVTLMPLRLSLAECGHSFNGLPVQLTERIANAAAVIRLRFDLEGIATLKQLRHAEAGYLPLHLTLAGDLPRALALHQTLLGSSQGLYATVPHPHGTSVLTLPLTSLRLSGVDDDEALLPPDFGGLPGLRMMREYFSQPMRLLGLHLHVLEQIARSNPDAREFELFFALREVPADLIGTVQVKQFRLFATPAINLYPKRIDPVPYDADASEQWLPVDRMAPAAHHLWSLTEVSVCERTGYAHPAYPVLDTRGYGHAQQPIRYAMRRDNEPLTGGTRDEPADPLASHDLISVTTQAGAIELDDIASIHGKALIADRHWPPGALLDARLQLLEPAAVGRVECLWPASAPRAIPSLEACWNAVSYLGQSLLSWRRGHGAEDITARVVRMLRLAARAGAVLDQQRIDSLRSVRIEPAFRATGRSSPQGLVRATCVEIDVASAAHADRGAWLFGRMLAEAFANAATHNDGIEVTIRIDGEIASTHTTLRSPEGRLL